MPLRRGNSKSVKRQNFHEFRHGATYARTKRKFGKKRANRQLAAVVLSQARKSKKRTGRRSARRKSSR